MHITEADLQAELAAIDAESIGWLPLGEGAYLHVGDINAMVVHVVGVPDSAMAGGECGVGWVSSLSRVRLREVVEVVSMAE